MRALTLAVCLLAATPAAHAAGGPRYSVISEDAGEIHRTIDVRLDQRFVEADLKQIAENIQARQPRAFRRSLVNFYLPGMKVGQGAWATATITNKTIAIRVDGLTLDEEDRYNAEARLESRPIVGTWLTSTPASPGRFTIFRERGKLFAEWRLRNGIKTTDEVTERKTDAGRRFENVPQTSDHFMLTASGDLELRRGNALIAIAARIDTSKLPPVVAVSSPSGSSAKYRASSARVSGSSMAAATVDADEPQQLRPRGGSVAEVGGGKATVQVTVKNEDEAAMPVAKPEPVKREERTAEPPRKRSVAQHVRQRSRSSGGVGAQADAGSAQDRLIKRMFRNPY